MKTTILCDNNTHPGLEIIIQTAVGLGRIYGALGGFHGFSEFDELEGIRYCNYDS